jgi:hypothetical protein
VELAEMQTPPSRVLDHDFDRVVVVGDPQICSRHLRAWKLAGVDAKRVSSKMSIQDLKSGITCVDVCSSDFPKKNRLIEKAIRSRIKVVTSEPLSDKREAMQRISGKGLTILEPMRHHPLVTKAMKLVSEGKIGSPRVLRLEVVSHDKNLSNFSLYEGLVHGVSAAHLLLKDAIAKKVYSKRVKTDYSTFYVSLLSFDNGATCQLVAGNTAEEGKLEFSINGPNGMIAFNESKTLETPSGLELSDAMSSTTSVEVLFRMFSDLIEHNVRDSTDWKKYDVVKAIEDSARYNKPISL